MPALASITRKPSPSLAGTGGETFHYPEAATQSFKKGDLVTLSSGKVAVAVAATNNLTDAGNEVLGIALADATGTTDKSIPVELINQETILRLPIYHATPGSAVTAVTLVGSTFQLRYNSVATGWFVDIGSASNAVAMVVNIDKSYPVGEAYGYVDVRILQAELVLDA